MKYIIILGDGMADRSVVMLNGKTPLEVAKKPNIDYCASHGECGMIRTIPDGMKPGSDVANLSVLGYAPDKYYTGRSPLEALSMGINMLDTDIAFRCNLVTLSDEATYESKSMVDYSAGEITTEEAEELINAVNAELSTMQYSFHAGVSYRHCLIEHNGALGGKLTPPHDISGKKIFEHLPSDPELLRLMKSSFEILSKHPINIARVESGKRPANSIWLWGSGSKPTLPSFKEMYGLNGAMISAVDLLKGIAIAGGMKVIDVEGANGRIDTNYKGKADACIEALNTGSDYVYIHIEAPDECGHQGAIKDKVTAIELIDKNIVGYLMEKLADEDYSMIICPDHATPLELKTHTSEAVPYVLYRSKHEIKGIAQYTEKECLATEKMYNSGEEMMRSLTDKSFLADKDNPIGVGIVADTAVVASEQDFILPEIERLEPVLSEDELDGAEIDGDVVAEITAELELAKEGKKKKKKEKKNKADKKPLTKEQKKKRIIALVITAVLAVGIIITAIVTPIMIINKDKIFVNDASDFGKVDKGNYYVLEKDIVVDGDLEIANPYSIDLRKHTLKVNGTLSFSHNLDNTLNIGTKKGKEYVEGGIITAKNIDISCTGAIISKALINVEKLTVVDANEPSLPAVTTQFDNGVNITSALSLTTGKHYFNNELTFAEAATATITDSSSTVIARGARTNIQVVNSSIELKELATPLNVILDSTSNAKIHAKVVGNVTGGGTVIMTATSAADTVSGMQTLWVTRESQSIKVIAVPEANIKYIVLLDMPKDMTVEHTSTGNIIVSATKVNHAERYAFYVDTNEPIIKLASDVVAGIISCDVTALTNTAGDHVIKVVAMGAEGVDEDLVTPSEPIRLTYTHEVKLEMPTGLKITVEGGKVWLAFNKVNFADEYLILINGKEITTRDIENLKIDITENVYAVGAYSIRVQARSAKNAALLSSDLAMTSYESSRKHETPIILEQKISEDGASIIFNWNTVDTAKRYTLYVESEGGGITELKLNTNSYTFLKDTLKSGDKVYVRADELGYYKNGDNSNIITIA